MAWSLQVMSSSLIVFNRAQRGCRLPVALFLAVALLVVACGADPTATSQRVPPTAVPLDSLGRASADVGAQLALSYGCQACHSADGSELVGPTWLGLYGTQESLEGGTSVTVNDEYITESIKDPDAKITKGFTAGLMPPTLGVRDEDIPHIIEYMKSLR